jgi:3',5'-cyclic AMP phosphodiesterase CpdA
MKKLITIILLATIIFILSSCKPYTIEYTNNDPFKLEIKGETLKILQVTDLHLAYGIDYRDRKTFELIKNLVNSDDYDLIVITGDLTMSPQAPKLFLSLISHMESLKIPWTFVFGNHETDFHDYEDFLSIIPETEYLLFKVGPEITNGGYGNFKIEFTKNNNPFYNAYFLDTKAERKNYTEEEGEYDYLSLGQVWWYEDLVQTDTVDSLVFMHIPLRQYIDPVNYVGIFNEDKVYAQGVDTGFFNKMVTYNRSKAVFVGHDHKNDFYLMMEGIMLAYGRATGYNGYGNLEKGGRHIEVLENKELLTYIILGSEVE